MSSTIGSVVSVPSTGLVPDHPPDAVQVSSPLLVQVRVVVPFAGAERGVADNVSETSIGFTVTDTLRDTEPPAPEHASV